MANLSSSTGAMSNLLIGLARGYWKSRRRIEKRYKGDLRKMADEVIKLEDHFVDDLSESLRGYFPDYQVKDLAISMIRMATNLEKKHMY